MAIPEGFELAAPEGFEVVPEASTSTPANVGVGLLESAAQGATLSLGDELGAGINAGIDQVGQLLGTDLGQGASGNETLAQAFNRRLDETRLRQDKFAEEQPVLDFAGRLAGGIAPSILSGGGSLAMLALKEAGLGGLESFGRTEDKLSQQGALDTATGALISGGLTRGLGKLGRPSRMGDRVNKKITEAIDRVEKRAGKRLITRAQEAGSEAGAKVEVGLENIPMVAATPKIRSNFQSSLNNEAITGIGQPVTKGKKLTVDVFQDAKTDLGRQFQNIFSGSKITVPKNLDDKLLDIAESHAQKIGTATDKKALNLVTDVSSRISDAMSGGKVDGRALQTVRSELLDLSRDATANSKTALKNTIGELTGLVDDTISEGLPKKALKQWRSTNQKWKNLKALTANDFVVNPATGDVSGKQLFRQLSKQAGGGVSIPQSPLSDLATLSKLPGVGDSGTAGRQLIAQAVTGAAAGGGGLASGTLAPLALTLAGMRGIGEIAQRAPQKAVTSLLGSTQRAADTSGLLTTNEILGR